MEEHVPGRGRGVLKNKCPHGGVWINPRVPKKFRSKLGSRKNNWAFNCLIDSLNSFLVCKILLFSVALKENLSTKTVVYGLFVIPPSSTPEFGPGSELRTF